MADSVKIGAGSFVCKQSVLKGKVVIGKNCKIINSFIEDCAVGDDTVINYSYLEKSKVGNNVTVGPYAHLRPDCTVCDGVHLGNFVEIKNSIIGKNSKVPHLSYVGDAEIGEDVNLGCGVIFANYDGVSKHKTVVGNRVFIGSNVNLVAPLFIEDESFIAAGTTVTKNVAKGEFCIGRSKQETKKGVLNLYAQKFDVPLKYFGTDGIRGVFGRDLTLELAEKVGFAITKLTPNPKVVIGRDTRPSGKELFDAVASGIVSGGGEVVDAGVVPTAAVAYLTRESKFDYGVSLTASHNTSEYNGIKVFNGSGFKLNENQELELEKNLELPKVRKKVKAKHISIFPYLAFLENVSEVDLTGIKLFLDCANGAGAEIALNLFKRLGAEIVAVNTKGEINKDSGVLDTDLFVRNMKDSGADIGFSFDGDADRVFACTRGGNILTGDRMLYLFARENNAKYVVGTIMTNYGLEKHLEKVGTKLVRTNVGDKYIAREMKSKGYKIGAEESGHVILFNFHTTGDGVLTAIYLLNIYKNNPKLFKEAEKLELYPVLNETVKTTDKQVVKNEAVKKAIKEAEKALGDSGRVIVRASGTEPKIRITIEGRDVKLAEQLIKVIKKAIENNKQA